MQLMELLISWSTWSTAHLTTALWEHIKQLLSLSAYICSQRVDAPIHELHHSFSVCSEMTAAPCVLGETSSFQVLCARSHLAKHRTIGLLSDYIAQRISGYQANKLGLWLGVQYSPLFRQSDALLSVTHNSVWVTDEWTTIRGPMQPVIVDVLLSI